MAQAWAGRTEPSTMLGGAVFVTGAAGPLAHHRTPELLPRRTEALARLLIRARDSRELRTRADSTVLAATPSPRASSSGSASRLPMHAGMALGCHRSDGRAWQRLKARPWPRKRPP